MPTVAIKYFVSPNFSLETICCATPHHVTRAGALEGAELIDDAIILTAKYHFNLPSELQGRTGP